MMEIMEIKAKVKMLPTICCGFYSGGWVVVNIYSIERLIEDNGWIRANYVCPGCGRRHELHPEDGWMQLDIDTICVLKRKAG